MLSSRAQNEAELVDHDFWGQVINCIATFPLPSWVIHSGDSQSPCHEDTQAECSGFSSKRVQSRKAQPGDKSEKGAQR
jgi:hypothetical protein